MKTKTKIIIASLIGVICGFLSTHAFPSIGWGNIIFWGVVGIIMGMFVVHKKEIMWTGLFYGFFLSLSFLITGFQGTSDKLPTFILFSLGLSIVGAFGGWLALLIGKSFSSGFKK